AGDGGTEITTDGGTLQMIATVEPDNASNKNVTWSVDDSSIATINSEGLLTAKTNGTVKVTATAKDGSGKSGFAEITITNQRTLKSVSIEVETNSDPLLSKPVVDAKLKIKNLEPTEAGATVTYQWQRSDHWDEDFTDIEGEKAETYTVKKDDEGKYIRLLVTGTGDYKGTVDSDSIEILPTYTVSFDLQGGTTSDSTDPIKVVPFSTYETYGTFPTVTKTDHTFHGWFTEETGGFKIEEGSWIDGELFTENKLTLYARWIKADDVLLVGATGISGTKDDTYLNNEGKEDTTNWTVHYNSTSKTLTLKGYNGGSIEVLNGFGEETLNLVLEGDNKVNGTIKGNYDKTPEKGSSLKIRENGTGKLEVEGSIRMSGSGKIEINSGTIDIKNGQLYVDKGGIIISGGKVNITEEVEYSAIWLYSSDLTLSGDAEVDIDIKNGYWTYYLFAIRANNIEIKDSSKLGIKANAVEDSWGLDINHTGGTLKIESGTTVDIMTSTEQSHHEAKAIHFREPATGKFIVSRVETEAPTGPNYTHNPTTKIETVTITGFVGAETGQTPIKISDLQTTDTNYEIVGLTWYEGDGNGEPKKMATGAKFKGDSGYYYEAVIELSAKTDYHFVPKDPDKTQVNISIVPNDWYHGIAWTKSTSKKLLISVTNNPYQ
ncbi:MAG: Ig-like domain-containing protein, partial [Anaerovoracaceae bacterium]